MSAIEGQEDVERVEVVSRNYPLGRHRVSVALPKRGGEVRKVVWVEEWTGPLWPLWLVAEEAWLTILRVWRAILGMTACRLLGHRAGVFRVGPLRVAICSRCKAVLEAGILRGEGG